MNLLLLTASPKKKGGASRLFARLLRGMLWGHRVTVCPLSGRSDFAAALAGMAQSDGVCLSFPLYVDGLPSHLVDFLMLAEEYCRSHSCRFRLYALATNGFVEGKQNQTALRMLEAWCLRSGIAWGGGIGIGGGTMLHVLGIVYPILIGLLLIQIVLSAICTGNVPVETLRSLVVQILSWLFLNSGVLLCMFRLSTAVRGQQRTKNRYTRVMLPAFLFIPIADLFMVLSSLLHGKLLFMLLKRDKWSPDER